MSTLAQLIDRTYREYLRPVEEQEYLSYMKKKLFAMISDYNFYIS